MAEPPTRRSPDVWDDHPSHRPAKGAADAAIHPSEENRLDPYESFTLGPGEKKVEEKLDTRMPNTSIFTFNREDHTLGNLIRDKLLSNSHVTFSGYKVAHPLNPKFELHVRTDGEITPKEALLGSCRELVNDLGTFRREFTKEYELRKMVSGAQNAK